MLCTRSVYFSQKIFLWKRDVYPSNVWFISVIAFKSVGLLRNNYFKITSNTPSNFVCNIWMVSPTFKGARILMPLLYCLHCSLFLVARLCAVVLVSLFGWRSVLAVGSKVRVHRPMSLWTGEVLKSSHGVLHQSRIANSGSFLSSLAFTSSPLQVFTAFSTFPFDCGYFGLDVQCSKCHWEEKFLNSWLSNSGPLSVISTSGIPWQVNCTLSWVITDCAVSLWISTSSKKLDQ